MTIAITAPPGGKIKQYNTDPTSPKAETAWVLKTSGAAVSTSGSPIGLLLVLTYANTQAGTADTYQLSYRTKEATTKRITIS